MYKFLTISGVLLVTMLVGIKLTNSSNPNPPTLELETVAELVELSQPDLSDEKKAALKDSPPATQSPQIQTVEHDGVITIIGAGQTSQANDKTNSNESHANLTLPGTASTTTIAATEGQALVQLSRPEMIFNDNSHVNDSPSENILVESDALGEESSLIPVVTLSRISTKEPEKYGASAPSSPPLPPLSGVGEEMSDDERIQIAFATPKFPDTPQKLSNSSPKYSNSSRRYSNAPRRYSNSSRNIPNYSQAHMISAPNSVNASKKLLDAYQKRLKAAPQLSASYQKSPSSAPQLSASYQKRQDASSELLASIKYQQRTTAVIEATPKKVIKTAAVISTPPQNAIKIKPKVKANYGSLKDNQWAGSNRSGATPKKQNVLQWQKAQRSWNDPNF